jgi:hypothetical protein
VIELNFEKILLAIGFVLAVSGLILAIGGATPTLSHTTRWAGGTATSIGTEGGNITGVNVAVSELTDRWAEFNGNVTGTIVLGDGSANVFSWTWASTGGGEVCVSTNASYDFSVASNATANYVDTAWSFPSAIDNATNTYTGNTCNLTFATASVTNTSYADITGSSTFNSCAVKATTLSTKPYFAFCTAIQATGVGKNYANNNANYELMVPTSYGAGFETYYFYAELG